MSALPGQTMEKYTHTLNQIFALNPEHISAYSLIIEEGTPFYELYGEHIDEKEVGEESKNHKNKDKLNQLENILTLPSEEEDRSMYEATLSLMHQHGYERYEISNYAKQGYECKHNCTYWKRGDYLGIGTGAASLLHNRRHSNECDLETYIELSKISNKEEYHNQLHQNKELLDEQSQMEEFMFLGLRMMQGVAIEEFELNFHQSIEKVYGKTIDKLVEEGLLTVNNDRISLTQHGIDISNYVMSEFLLD